MGQLADPRQANASIAAARANLHRAHQSLADALQKKAPRAERDVAIREWERAITDYIDSLAPPRLKLRKAA